MNRRLRLEVLESRDNPSLVVPQYSSAPQYTNTLYIKFDGDTIPVFLNYKGISSPAYSQDGDVNNFSDNELRSIRSIWEAVAEDYAPFRINVTTIAPPINFAGKVSKIIVGGNGGWLPQIYGGYASIGTFATSGVKRPAIGFVFPDNLANGYAKFVADAVSHEAGHNMGLRHQSEYKNGKLVAEYYEGLNDNTGPLMGNSYTSWVSRWWRGPKQDDFTILKNRLGVRVDDHPKGRYDKLSPSVDVKGIIETETDIDYFGFRTGNGPVVIKLRVPVDNNLIAKMRLLNKAGQVLATSLPDGENAMISINLPTGDYLLEVSGSGRSSGSTSNNYGFNIGTYTLTGYLQYEN